MEPPDTASAAIHSFVITRAQLALYDPLQSRRPKLAVHSFTLEFLELDEDAHTAHAAGPVVLDSENGPVERHLKLSVPFIVEDGHFTIPYAADYRAAYVEITNPATGACKESLALANC